MNVRTFLAVSTILLLGWMTVSYLRELPAEGYFAEGTESLKEDSLVSLSEQAALLVAEAN